MTYSQQFIKFEGATKTGRYKITEKYKKLKKTIKSVRNVGVNNFYITKEPL